MPTDPSTRKAHKVVLAIVPAESVPTQQGEFSEPLVAGGVALALHGWDVVSHAVTQQLSGDLLLSLFCERDEPDDREPDDDGVVTIDL